MSRIAQTLVHLRGAALITLILLSFALILEASDSTSVSYGGNAIITAFSTCRSVTNNSSTGLSVYVPTVSDAEWASFYGSPPSGVSASVCASCNLPWGGSINHGESVTAYSTNSSTNCAAVSETRTCTNGTLSGSYTYSSCSAPAPTCGGDLVGGYCWYIGNLNQSCDQVCNGHGGCNLAGTRNYAGSGGTNGRCFNVKEAVTPSYWYPSATTWGGVNLGCYAQTTGLYRGDALTTCAAKSASATRYCACNN